MTKLAAAAAASSPRRKIVTRLNCSRTLHLAAWTEREHIPSERGGQPSEELTRSEKLESLMVPGATSQLKQASSSLGALYVANSGLVPVTSIS